MKSLLVNLTILLVCGTAGAAIQDSQLQHAVTKDSYNQFKTLSPTTTKEDQASLMQGLDDTKMISSKSTVIQREERNVKRPTARDTATLQQDDYSATESTSRY